MNRLLHLTLLRYHGYLVYDMWVLIVKRKGKSHQGQSILITIQIVWWR